MTLAWRKRTERERKEGEGDGGERRRALALSRNTAQLGAAVINGLHFPNRSVLRCGTQVPQGKKKKRGGGLWGTEAERKEALFLKGEER